LIFFYLKSRSVRAKKVPTALQGMDILVSLEQWCVNIAQFFLLKLAGGSEK
jgi:hypothetical protein